MVMSMSYKVSFAAYSQLMTEKLKKRIKRQMVLSWTKWLMY